MGLRRPLCRFLLAAWSLALAAGTPQAPGDLVRLFPLEAYDRLARPWLEPEDGTPLLPGPFQTRRAKAFQEMYLGPWEAGFVQAAAKPEVLSLEARVMANLHKDYGARSGFGPHHRPYDSGWLQRLRSLLPAPQTGPVRFEPSRRAISVDNVPLRLMPTVEPYFQSHRIPGQGYPFDNFQNGVLWAGTPVYLLGATRDGAWTKVLAPGVSGWVRTLAVARVGAPFVSRWREAVARHGLAAAIATEAPVTDARGQFRFHAYVGSVFPQGPPGGRRRSVLLASRSGRSGQAILTRGFLPEGAAVAQGWPYTPAHAAQLWKSLLGRPYGWGNLHFHNDCSAELRHFFTPFGLWLPRHSADQREAGPKLDLSHLGLEARIATLRQLGRPYRTLVWIEGHVMLYLGPVGHLGEDGVPATGFMTYQNLWGLRPKAPPDYRAVVGGAVLFPVLDRHPEGPELVSLADRSRFVLTFLDEDPPAAPGPALAAK